MTCSSFLIPFDYRISSMADELSDIVKLLFAELKDLKSSFNSLILTSTASLVIVFGWFMTSADAQRLVQSNQTTACMVSVGLIMTFVSLVYCHWRWWYHSKKVKSLLSATQGFSSDDYFKQHIINASTVIIMELTQLTLIICFMWVLWHIEVPPPARH